MEKIVIKVMETASGNSQQSWFRGMWYSTVIGLKSERVTLTEGLKTPALLSLYSTDST